MEPDPSTGKYCILAFLFPDVKGSSCVLLRLSWHIFCLFGFFFWVQVLFCRVDLSSYLMGAHFPPTRSRFSLILALVVYCPRGGGPVLLALSCVQLIKPPAVDWVSAAAVH